MANMRKFSDMKDIGHLCAHYERKQTTHTESEVKEWVIEPADLDRQGKDTVILIAADEPDGYLKLKKNYYFKR